MKKEGLEFSDGKRLPGMPDSPGSVDGLGRVVGDHSLSRGHFKKVPEDLEFDGAVQSGLPFFSEFENKSLNVLGLDIGRRHIQAACTNKSNKIFGNLMVPDMGVFRIGEFLGFEPATDQFAKRGEGGLWCALTDDAHCFFGKFLGLDLLGELVQGGGGGFF